MGTTGIIILLVVSGFMLNIALAIFGGNRSKAFGYGFARGFIIVFFAPFLGIIAVLTLEDVNGKEMFAASSGMKGINKREQDNIAKGVAAALKENKGHKLK